MRCAHARNAAGDDLAPLRDEGVQQLHVLVIDIVDLLDAEAAYLLVPEVLFLLGGDSLVTARGPLRGAAWSSSGFRHGLTLPLRRLGRQPRSRQARTGRCFGLLHK